MSFLYALKKEVRKRRSVMNKSGEVPGSVALLHIKWKPKLHKSSTDVENDGDDVGLVEEQPQ